MGAQLVSTVWVPGKDTADMVSFGPGDDVPEWAARKMGAHCFEDGVHPFGDGASMSAPDDENGPPPKSGRGSGKGAWSDYAESDEVAAQLEAAAVEIPAEAGRDDIIAALEKAGVRTE